MTHAVAKLRSKVRTWWIEELKAATLPSNRISNAYDEAQFALGKECDPDFERRTFVKVTDLDAGKVLEALEVACDTLQSLNIQAIVNGQEGQALVTARIQKAQAEITRLLESGE